MGDDKARCGVRANNKHVVVTFNCQPDIVRFQCQNRRIWEESLNEGLSRSVGLLLCLWEIALLRLIEVGRPSLKMGGTIPWV